MITIEHQRWFDRELTTRLPFKYGIAVMTRVPHVWLELRVTIEGQVVKGWAADHLPPKWFTKDPNRPVAEEEAEMRRVLRQAGTFAAGLSGATVFDCVMQLEHQQLDWARQEGLPPLLARFGSTFVERALLDAYCRRHDQSLAGALQAHGFGLRLGQLHEELAGSRPRDWLPSAPLPSVLARHTVGLADALEEVEVKPEEAPADPLPVSLAAAIREYQLEHFKIKVMDGEAGLERLIRVVEVIERCTGGRYFASVDGNETFASPAAFRTFWERARQERRLASLWSRLLFVEQPFHRKVALGREVEMELKAWPDRPRLIIDESGAEIGDLRRAVAIGYAGVSHKNCKGVLHGVANACLLAHLRRTQPEVRWLMSGEDLSNVGPIALPQDLAVQAALGNDSVERNGHHYFAGLSGWPVEVQGAAVARYPDLYAWRSEARFAAVKVEGGRVATGGVNGGAFGGLGFESLGSNVTPWHEQ